MNQADDTSVWVIVGILTGCGLLAVFVSGAFAWILKAVIERFIKSVDLNAQATSGLTQELHSYKILVDGALDRIEERQQHAQEIIDLQFRTVHSRLDKGAAFHDELREWKPTVEQELSKLRNRYDRIDTRKMTAKVQREKDDEN